MECVLLANPLYRVDEDIGIINTITNEIIDKDNKVIELEIYGQKIKKEFEWFLNLAKYEIQLPPQCYNRIKDITFRKTGFTLSKHYSVLVQTKEPIIHTYKGVDYAIVLGFDFNMYKMVGIDSEGNMLDIHKCDIIRTPSHDITNTKDYKCYSFGKHNVKKYYLHRLMLSAWLWNERPMECYQGNHKDLDKLNNSIDNLEWVTPKDNLKHLIENGDQEKLGNIECKSREKKTSKISNYSSISDMCGKLNIIHRTSEEFRTMRLGFLFNGHEIRVDGDTRDWFYQDPNDREIPRTAIRIYRLYKGDKLLETFYSTSEINDYFNYYGFRGFAKLVEYSKRVNAKYKLVAIPLIQDDVYQAMNIKTRELLESDNITKLSEKTSNNPITVARRIRSSNITKPIGDWVYRVKTKEPWINIDFSYKTPNVNRKIKVTNVLTKKVTIYNSVASASEGIGTTRRTLKLKIKSKERFKDFIIEDKE